MNVTDVFVEGKPQTPVLELILSNLTSPCINLVTSSLLPEMKLINNRSHDI